MEENRMNVIQVAWGLKNNIFENNKYFIDLMAKNSSKILQKAVCVSNCNTIGEWKSETRSNTTTKTYFRD